MGYTDLPLGETKFHVSTALSSETGAVLERPADRARSDGQVAVVAGKVDNCQRNFATRHRNLDSRGNVRQTSGFPRENHLDCGKRMEGFD
jgi:hypothetical protein